MRGLLVIQLTLAITRATDRHPALARRLGWKEETANRIFTSAVRSGAMIYAKDHLVRTVRGEPMMGDMPLKYSQVEDLRKHREDQDMVLGQLEPFLQRIIYYLTEPLRYLKQQEEMSLEEAHIFLGTDDERSAKDKGNLELILLLLLLLLLLDMGRSCVVRCSFFSFSSFVPFPSLSL